MHVTVAHSTTLIVSLRASSARDDCQVGAGADVYPATASCEGVDEAGDAVLSTSSDQAGVVEKAG